MDFYCQVDWFARLKERKQRDGWRLGDISVEHNLTFSSSVLDKFISRTLRWRIYAHKQATLESTLKEHYLSQSIVAYLCFWIECEVHVQGRRHLSDQLLSYPIL